jgi:uncharacterized protein with HEPN domain
MKRDPSAYLWDMQQACAAIGRFVQDKSLESYVADLMLRSAVERQLQNIGEALSQLSKLDAALASRVPRQRQLIGFRNVLVHGCAGLNDAEVWRVLHGNLPELHKAVTRLLEELGPNP